MQRSDKILRIIYAVLFVAAVAGLARAFVDTSSEWYLDLVKPQLQPPPIAFIIVWAVQYTLLAASMALTAANPLTTKKTLFLYVVSGLLNVLWTCIFFYRQNPAGAVIVLILHIAGAVALYADVHRIDKKAAWLLLPLIVWLCFALYLNYEIAFLN